MNEKDTIRHRVWNTLTNEKLGRFPFPLKKRIPNFKGAEQAAHHVTTLPIYQKAKAIKVNPDAPQLPLRTQILIDGKILLVPTPRLRAGFIVVKPEWVPKGEERKAASIKHMRTYGKEVSLTDIPSIDLFVAGSVAVTKDGKRIGKGEGYSDREYAILLELGHPHMPVISTVHSVQVVDEDVPKDPYDLIVDWVVTEKGCLQTNSPYDKPSGILWEKVTEEERNEMPVLNELYQLKKDK
ncbi:5-formyltetrahydrofolate cyclo-ligase [Bacillus sp. FJAT-47783]|uniref:5-formyltetrahydrofolate cyclo-ligase n=1 Tax=Bacillus sp. FJAT-47783 TaxID=2922712 RepID=UPI001FAE5528|nr:5-formyltetrahydrofolate cyclo-ligase [Bacillus sp. FJAT-47783]